MRLRRCIAEYFEACNTGDAARLELWFTDDAAHYFTRLPPTRGRRAIAESWSHAQQRLQARWAIEHVIEQGNEACIEWTMTWTDPDSGERRLERGTEWYVFEDGRIAEIRAYHHSNRRNPSGDLIGFDHAARGDTMLAG
jgi:ketosteroid isomerase-like protein